MRDRIALRRSRSGKPIDLERKGFCDSYAWSLSVPTPDNPLIIQAQPGEILRLYKRWYPLTSQRIPL